MIRQEVNLYSIDFHRGDQAFSFRTTVMAASAFFAILLLVNGYGYWDMFQKKQQLTAINLQAAELNSRVEQLKSTRPLSQRVSIEKEISELVDELDKRKSLLDVIGGQNMGNGEGFSVYLEALSRQALPEVSLTEFNILRGGSYVELAGWTVKPESVPFYLNRLRDEAVFKQVKFGVLAIKKDEKHSNKLQFSLGKDQLAKN